jgi:hypothetical protein
MAGDGRWRSRLASVGPPLWAAAAGLAGAAVLWVAAFLETMDPPPLPASQLGAAQAVGAGFLAFLGLVAAMEWFRGRDRPAEAGARTWGIVAYLQGVSGVAGALGVGVVGRDVILGSLPPRGPVLAVTGLAGLVAARFLARRTRVPTGFAFVAGIGVTGALVALTPWFPVTAVLLVGALSMAQGAADA